jgi:hypothetical protein
LTVWGLSTAQGLLLLLPLLPLLLLLQLMLSLAQDIGHVQACCLPRHLPLPEACMALLCVERGVRD